MYFSLIAPLEGQDTDAARERLNGPYAEHQWLWRLFPSKNGTPRDFLFRRREVEGKTRYYVLSQRPPQPPLPGWDVQTRPYHPQLRIGDRLQFELRANPVVARRKEGKSYRHDVVMDQKKRLLAKHQFSSWAQFPDNEKPQIYELIHTACAAWLTERAPPWGFTVNADNLHIDGYQQHAEKKDRRLRFTTVDFTGVLTVTEPSIFAETLCHGLGHAKAFGCGLLLVRHVD